MPRPEPRPSIDGPHVPASTLPPVDYPVSTGELLVLHGAREVDVRGAETLRELLVFVGERRFDDEVELRAALESAAARLDDPDEDDGVSGLLT